MIEVFVRLFLILRLRWTWRICANFRVSFGQLDGGWLNRMKIADDFGARNRTQRLGWELKLQCRLSEVLGYNQIHSQSRRFLQLLEPFWICPPVTPSAVTWRLKCDKKCKQIQSFIFLILFALENYEIIMIIQKNSFSGYIYINNELKLV